MKSSTVVVAAGLYPPDIGGPATYAAMIERTLPANGITVVVVPYRTVRTLSKWRRHVTYTWRLWKAAGEADLIYALDPVSVGVPAWLVSVLRRRPLLLRLGGDYAWEQGRQRFGVTDTLDVYSTKRKQAAFPVRVLHAVQAFVAKRAVAVVVPSVYLGEIIATWGVAKEKIVVIYSAVSPLSSTMAKDEARRHYGLSGFVVVTAARLTPWKGVAGVLTAVKMLRDQGIDAMLVIAGDGPERAALEAQTVALGLVSQTHFLGAVSKAELGDLLRAADAFVLNTAYEGLSHQLLEVMAAQVPIVTTDIGGNRELVRNGVDGILVPYNDVDAILGALASLARHPQTAATYVASAATVVTRFDHETSVTALINLITTYARR